MAFRLGLFSFGVAVMLGGCSDPGPVAVNDGQVPEPIGDKSRGRQGTPMGQYLHANMEARGRQAFQTAYKLERAVWSYAADNGGVFPHILGGENTAGLRVFDYLPGRKYLWNAFTGVRDNPREGAALHEGEVAYLPLHDERGYVVGYRITAQGAYDPPQYLTLDYVLPRTGEE